MLTVLLRDAPWVLKEADVGREFRDAGRPEIQWERLGDVPKFLAPILEAKAVSTKSVYLAERLFEQLGKLGTGPRQLADLAVERVIEQGTPAMPAYRVARCLGSGKLWAEPGRRLLEHVIQRDSDREATMWLADLVDSVDKANHVVTKAIHAVLAEVIIVETEAALKRADTLRVSSLLRGLAELTVPPRLFRNVRALRGLTQHDGVKILIEANEGLMGKGDDEVPEVDGLKVAIALCTDFAGDADQWRPS